MIGIKYSKTKKVTGRHTFRRGVHPPENKHFSEDIEVVPITASAGSTLVIPMSQHVGAPCKPLVKAKEEVTVGQKLGQADAFVSAPVHSPVNGTIKSVSPQPHPSGRKVMSVVITVAQEQPAPAAWKELPSDFAEKTGKLADEKIPEVIRECGIVGMGGAAFPTAVKLTRNIKKPVDTVILNGCECEPYLTSDHRLMLEAGQTIVAGLQLALRAAGAQHGIIAIEDNKPDAVSSILALVKQSDNLQLAICQTKYPQGGEKQLIKAVLNREVPTGGLPLDVGVVVVNVGTAAAIAWACYENRPLTERIVTLTGRGVNKPGNYRVPVGMLVGDFIEQCGGLKEEAAKVLLGGPMMGPSTSRLDIPIMKGTSGITVMCKDDIFEPAEMPCIRCSRCVDYCPMGLVPTRIAHAVKARELDLALQYDLLACVECGCCAYVCPSQIRLLQYIRTGKALARKQK